MTGSFENALNWCSSFYNSKGCIYLHMIREMLSQIFKNTISKLRFLLLSHLVLTSKQSHWMLA